MICQPVSGSDEQNHTQPLFKLAFVRRDHQYGELRGYKKVENIVHIYPRE